MNRKSIKFRLTFWYTVSLIVAIMVIFTSFYFITRLALHTQTNNTLITHGQKIIEVVTRSDTDIHSEIAKEAFVNEFSNIPGMLVVIVDRSGAIISSSQAVNPTNKVVSDLFEKVLINEKSFFVDRIVGSQSLRFLVTPIVENNSFVGTVIIGHPIGVIQSALDSLIVTLGVIFIIFLIPTILGGYINARAAIMPIAAISEKLKKINASNLDVRVDNPKTADEIEELSTTFNSLLDRLHGSFQRERQFIGDVAHEMKTPLSAQRTNIEIALARDRSKEDLRHALEESLIDNNQLSTTLKNVLDLAWSEADGAREQFENFNLSEVVEEITDLGLKMAVEKQIVVKGDVDPNIIISGKKDKLGRALINLVDNAIKYTPPKGTISLSLRKSSAEVQFRIKDTGVGILEKDLTHIFERFHRGSKTDQTFGSGLGLAIAQAIIKAHRGDIRAKSTAGMGSEFTVILPLASS